RRLAERAIAAHRAVGSGEKYVRPSTDVVLHAELRSERMHRLDEARLDCGNQRGMRIQRPVAADLSAQAERLGVGRQQQLDRCGVESDTVVQAIDAVLRVD